MIAQTRDLALINFSETQTMDSREIAGLTGKRHDNILRSVKRMFAELEVTAHTFEDSYLADDGSMRPCFRLPKRECLILAAGFNVKLRAAIIDRWAELESGKAIPLANQDPRISIQNEYTSIVKSHNELFDLLGYSEGWKEKNALELASKIERENGFNPLPKAILDSSSIGIPDASSNPDEHKHAAKYVVGSQCETVTEISRKFEELSSTEVNKILVDLGYQVRISKSQFVQTEKSKGLSNTRKLQSGPFVGTEVIIGWHYTLNSHFRNELDSSISEYISKRDRFK